MNPSLVDVGDGRLRCAWACSSDAYVRYHDDEWGRPVRGDGAIFERISLEAFQSGLSWITILRKRDAFRQAFAGFSIDRVAEFTDEDVARCLADPGIVRNTAKIRSTIANAVAIRGLRDREGEGALDRLVWSHAPESRPRPARIDQVPARTPESTALAAALKARGIRFVGPTTAYAAMQAMGLVDDHVEGCVVPRISARGH